MENSTQTNDSLRTSESSRPNHNWISWLIQLFTLVIVALVGYNLSSTKVSINNHIAQLQEEVLKVRADEDGKVADMAQQLDSISERAGLTASELDASKKNTEKLRQDQEKSKAALAKQIEDTTNGVTQLQQDTDSKFGAVNGEVKDVATNLGTTRQDLGTTRQDLDTARQDLTRIHQDLTAQIARNSSELADLRKKGDRDYVEFAIRKDKKNVMQRVADIQLAVTGTDPKRQKFDMIVLVDDHKIERKDRVANEPLQFLVGHDQVRYEVVVNYVDKDQIRGYVSTPKDKAAGAERPVALKSER
jgi:hypothetical protein